MKKTLLIVLTIYEIPVIIIAMIIIGISTLINPSSNIHRTIKYIVDEYIIFILVLSTIFWTYIYIMFIK